MKECMTILAVGAHPDDLELQCSGTLARYAAARHKVYMCHATNGDKGHFIIPPDELAATRLAEAQAAAAVVGAEHLALGFPDAGVVVTIEMRDRFIDLIRQTRPDVLITHSPNDYAADHCNVSQLVFDASFFAGAPHYKTRLPQAHDRIPAIYYMETAMGVDFLPDEYVDISDVFDVKRKAVVCHRSQITWLKEHDNLDMLEYAEVQSRFRGIQSGVKYAEAFCRCDRWPRIRAKRLLP